jgi:putative membrane protein
MAAAFAASWWQPLWPVEQGLHSILTIAAAIGLWTFVRKYGMDDSDFFLIALFFAVHCLATRWLYSNVPYEDWLQSSIGLSPHWERNHFDRLVHFLYGFCLTPALTAHAARRYGLNPTRSFQFAIAAIMLTSLWYEWFEWLVAITLGAETAETYNGQQGDIWDAHKDILLATVGSLLRFPPKTPDRNRSENNRTP